MKVVDRFRFQIEFLNIFTYLFIVLQAQVGDLSKVELFRGATLKNVQHILTGGLEMSCRIERTGYEYLGLGTHVNRLIDVRNLDEPETQKIEVPLINHYRNKTYFLTDHQT